MIFPIHSITLLNVIIVAVLLLFLWSGFRRGFLMKVLDCFSTIVIAVITWYASGWLYNIIRIVPKDVVSLEQATIAQTVYDMMNRVCVFALLFIVIWLIVMIAKPLFKTISSLPILQGINKLLGVLFGALQAVIILIIVVFIMQTPLFANGEYVVANSYLKYVAEAENSILDKIGTASKDMMAIQKIVTPNTELSKEDEVHVREWLRDQGINEQEINEFMNEVMGN